MRVRQQHRSDLAYRARHCVLLVVLMGLFGGLFARLVDLTIFEYAFLNAQGEQRVTRQVPIPAHRGMILDARRVPLAMSTEMFSLWINPYTCHMLEPQIAQLAQFLGVSQQWLQGRLHETKRRFVYIKRHLGQALYHKVKALHIRGLHVQSEFVRHYPFGPVLGQLVGFTNLEDHGQEGLELSLDRWLSGQPGRRVVETDLQGNVVGERKVLQSARQGHNVQLTLDHRIQYVAYRHLKQAVEKSGAVSGSVIVMQPQTGHVLAMANYPSFDPNIRHDRTASRVRNRAVSDVYEPGSTAKAFAAIALLRAGYQPWSHVNVGHGRMSIQGHVIHDEVKDLGVITLAEVLKKSSNVGIAKFALKIRPDLLLDVLRDLGLGLPSEAGLIGEASGTVRDRIKAGGFDHAAMAYGYGMSLTHLQLAHAYSIIANDGLDAGVHFIANKAHRSERVLKHTTVQKLINMLTHVTDLDGSGKRARVPGVLVAGKTGTALIASSHGYQPGRVNVSFVGMAPAKHPKLVVSVMIHKPGAGYRFGGVAAAPVFSKVVADSLLLLG